VTLDGYNGYGPGLGSGAQAGRILGGTVNSSQAATRRFGQTKECCDEEISRDHSDLSSRKYGLRILTIIIPENTLFGYWRGRRETSAVAAAQSIKECMKAKLMGLVAGGLFAMSPFVSNAAALPAPFEGSTTLQADGLVKAIDVPAHSIIVLDAQGSEASFTITDPRSLAQIREGGKVHIRMMRNAVVSVTSGADGQGSVVRRAPADTVNNVSATVEAIDHVSGVMALKGASGSVFHIQSRDPARLAGVVPGMQVMVAFESQVNVAVAPAQ
jgi:hypothetical protein